MSEKLSDRLERLLTDYKTCGVGELQAMDALREAAAVLRAVEGAAVVEIDASGDEVQLIAEGSWLDRAATAAKVYALNKQRVALVPLDAAGSAEGVS